MKKIFYFLIVLMDFILVLPGRAFAHGMLPVMGMMAGYMGNNDEGASNMGFGICFFACRDQQVLEESPVVEFR